jgi:hypothetical protein
MQIGKNGDTQDIRLWWCCANREKDCSFWGSTGEEVKLEDVKRLVEEGTI